MDSPEDNGDGKCGGQPAKAGIVTIIGGTGGRHHAENVSMTILFCAAGGRHQSAMSNEQWAITQYQFNTTQYQ
ncbi:hypothetical protein [Janthinobacterium sp. BJB401]|uniref:hypothetical protein n=1 Tax=Janthinobacterium sp. BJB401 TaxID=2745934 RepID=UPI001595FDCE|nr:hypothetical protein [Janthinobacterium sp. BJB401]NVI80249.1 hypothetical protein [Janthinobacterium sp. BJB401]